MKPYTKNTTRPNNTGFTIIELLIATVVFSVVLVVVLAAFVQTSRIYYKGVNTNNTQEATRTITQDIADDIKFDQGDAPQSFNYEYATKQTGQFCIGQHRYSFQLGQQVGGAVYGLQRDTINAASGCPTVAGVNSEQMLDSGMQLNAIGINCLNGRCTINVHVVFYGSDNTVLASGKSGYSTDPWRAPDAECTGGVETSQFCSVADYNRTISTIQG